MSDIEQVFECLHCNSIYSDRTVAVYCHEEEIARWWRCLDCKRDYKTEQEAIACECHAPPPPCPACEAAQNDVRLMQARLQRLIDAEPQRELADLRARLEAEIDKLDTTAMEAYAAGQPDVVNAIQPHLDVFRDLLRKEAK